jgi:hypothetical protein
MTDMGYIRLPSKRAIDRMMGQRDSAFSILAVLFSF